MAAAPHPPRSLDIAEPQVAIDLFGDVFQWHMRVLLVNAGGGKWIFLTPDLEVQFSDLAEHRVVPVPRSTVFPARVRDSLYRFDPLTQVQLDQARADAAALAAILGVTAAAAPGQIQAPPRWIFCDAAREDYGKEVEADVVADESRFLRRGAIALVKMGDTDET